jgi:DNA-directed RNA polymerase
MCKSVIATLQDIKKQIGMAERGSDRRKILVEYLRDFKEQNREIIGLASPIFWNAIKDDKHRRKIVKRNVMTLPYGGTPYGLGEQQIDDARKHGVEALMTLEHKWGSFMGRAVYDTCQKYLKRLMNLLSIFEKAGKRAEAEGRYLSWNTPIVNFPVVQHYEEGTTKKLWVQYGPPKGAKKSTGYYENTLQLRVSFLEIPKPSPGRQASGAAPNITHSLDATHLIMTSCAVDFTVTTAHDSFGSLLCDMPELYIATREQFYRLYKNNPLDNILIEIEGDAEEVDKGTYDPAEMLKSEFGFS